MLLRALIISLGYMWRHYFSFQRNTSSSGKGVHRKQLRTKRGLLKNFRSFKVHLTRAIVTACYLFCCLESFIPFIRKRTVMITSRPPSVSGGRCWLKSEQRSFVIYRRNTYEQYGGYNLFQNAEFEAKFSIKAWRKC